MKVFLQVVIGNIEQYQRELAAYNAGLSFIKQHASWIDCSEPLSQEQIDTLTEMAASHPDSGGEGSISFVSPKELDGGRIEIELFSDRCPKASQNFFHLCKGDKGESKSAKKPLHYKDSKFFRIVPEYIAQGGDITRGDGSGGDSIYNGKFNDDKAGLTAKFDQPGQLGMANSGKNTNTSQFFFTLPSKNGTSDPKQYAKLNGKYVNFGQVTQGLEILKNISETPLKSGSEKPMLSITITSCGEVA